MEKLNDLRYVIALFFAAVGAVLIILPLTMTDTRVFASNLNLFTGGAMVALAIFLFWTRGKDK